MKNKREKHTYIPAKFPALIIIACFTVVALGIVGATLSIWRIVHFGARTPLDIIKYVAIFPICAFCIAVPLSIVLCSGYTISPTTLTQTFGVFRTKLPVADISSILLNSDEGKLIVYANGQTITPLIALDNNEKLTRALMNANPDIEYGFTLTEKPEDKQE